MAAVRTSASSSMASGTAGITATFGTGATAGDTGLLLVETAGQSLPSTPTGWTSLGSASSAGTPGAAGCTELILYYKVGISAGDISGGIAVGDSGDHTSAVLLTFSGLDSTTPFAIGGGTGGISVATTTLQTGGIASGSATVDDLVLGCFATDRDSATAATNSGTAWGGMAGSNSFPINFSSASGQGGGLIVNQLTPSGAATGTIFVQFTSNSTIYSAQTVVAKAAVTTRTATLSKTLGALTASSTATVKIVGTLSKTLGALTTASTGTVKIVGTLSKTLGTLTVVSSGGNTNNATFSKTLGSLTTSSTAQLILKGSLSKTFGTLTASETGHLLLQGTLAKTLGTLTITSTAKVKIVGSLGKTLDSLTVSGTSRLLLKGSLNSALGSLTGTETGTLIVKGSVSTTLGILTLAGNSVLGTILTGQVVSTLEVLTGSSTGQLLLKGATTSTLGILTSSSTGVLYLKGTAACTLGNLTGSGTGHLATPILGYNNNELGSLIFFSTGDLGPVVSVSLRRKGPLGEPINSYRSSKFIRSGRGYWTK